MVIQLTVLTAVQPHEELAVTMIVSPVVVPGPTTLVAGVMDVAQAAP
jgi:hypothetical protein